MPRIIKTFLLIASAFGSLACSAEIKTRGFFISAPKSESIPRFVAFIENELAPRGINTLILRVDYGFAFQSHPELISSNALSLPEVKKLVATCKKHDIQLIPQINLLGHQSWATRLNKLLEVYPEFDETPHVAMPETYKWPNADDLYCKSYCPLHPEIHDVVFALIDEVMEAFEASTFHAGMDEVFYIGDSQCPRCAGKNKAELFANEVETIRRHLETKGQNLIIWGDRLLDGASTGLGEWQASTNDTHAAIDLISKEVIIYDWHYTRAEPTAAYFAMKGFQVVTCPWNQPEVANAQYEAMLQFKENANSTLANRYQGMTHTVWSSAESFLDDFEKPANAEPPRHPQIDCFLTLFENLKPQ